MCNGAFFFFCLHFWKPTDLRASYGSRCREVNKELPNKIVILHFLVLNGKLIGCFEAMPNIFKILKFLKEIQKFIGGDLLTALHHFVE